LSVRSGEREIAEEIVENPVADFNIKSICTWFGKANSVEKYYVCAFSLSIFLGMIFGLFDHTLYDRIYPLIVSASTSAFGIFLHNFVEDIMSVLTGGILQLLSNFLTFAVIAGAFDVRQYDLLRVFRILLVAFGSYGVLEMAGHLCFGLVGFTYLERLVLKKRTGLRKLNLFILGVILVFVAAVIEAQLLVAFHP
jgi:hypothetical protein